MMNRFEQVILIFTIAIVLTATQAQAKTVVIDDFASGIPLSSFGTDFVVDDGPHAGVIGGYRDVFVSHTGTNIYYSPISSNTFVFDNIYSSYGHTQLTYDGPGTGGSLGLNLLDVGTEGYFTIHNFRAQGGGSIDFIVWDNSGGRTDFDLFFVDNNTNRLGYIADHLVFDYDLFRNSVDLSDIKKISIFMGATTRGTDAQLGSVTATTIAVPEPASITLLGMSCILMMRRRQRHRIF